MVQPIPLDNLERLDDASITGRDHYRVVKALLYAIETIEALPQRRQEWSDYQDVPPPLIPETGAHRVFGEVPKNGDARASGPPSNRTHQTTISFSRARSTRAGAFTDERRHLCCK
jgi:hypothetical protein